MTFMGHDKITTARDGMTCITRGETKKEAREKRKPEVAVSSTRKA